MGKISPQTTSKHLDLDGIEAHYSTLDAYTVGFEFSAHDEDPALLFTGLPDNACQARHWGVVLEGTLVIRYTDNSEDVIEAGEAYYAPPGHLPLFKAGTRLIEFSPTHELDKTMAKVMVNVDAIQDALIDSGALGRLEVPVSVAFGETDRYLNPSLAAEIARLFKGPSVHLVQDASRWPQYDQPEVVADLLKAARTTR